VRLAQRGRDYRKEPRERDRQASRTNFEWGLGEKIWEVFSRRDGTFSNQGKKGRTIRGPDECNQGGVQEKRGSKKEEWTAGSISFLTREVESKTTSGG